MRKLVTSANTLLTPYIHLHPICKMARTLHLTNAQFAALYDILAETVEYIEGDLITTEDENGNEIREDITDYEAHKIYQQMIRMSGGF